MDFLLLAPLRYGNIASSTKCIAYLKLAFSSRGIVLLLFIQTVQLTFTFSTDGQLIINLDSTDALLGNAYIQVTIFHEHELYVCYENYCVTSIWNIRKYANFVLNLLEYLISAVSS